MTTTTLEPGTIAEAVEPRSQRHPATQAGRVASDDRLVRAHVAVVIVNYGPPALTIQCLESLAPEAARRADLAVLVVENGSEPPRHEEIEDEIMRRGWSRWAHVVPVGYNGGFASGNNAGLAAADADFYLLLNSDTIVRAGAIDEMLHAAARHPQAGLIGPRLEWPDGTPQESAFRFRTPRTELLAAAKTGLVTKLLGGTEVAHPISSRPIRPDWLSFACVLIRRELVQAIGELDDGYFMYLEDIDYCRRARAAGWHCLHWPAARVVHLRGGTSPVKTASAKRTRRPRYYYASRTRYFFRHFGRAGLRRANLLWTLGRLIALPRELVGLKPRHTCRREGIDIWTNFHDPMIHPAAEIRR